MVDGVQIRKGNAMAVSGSPNFTEREFFTTSPDYRRSIMYMDRRLALAAQRIRTFLNKPVRVNSSARTRLHQQVLGGNPDRSQHVNEDFEGTGYLGTYALDLDSDDQSISILAGQFLEKGPLYNELVGLGIKGFGVYNGFVHIDTGEKPGYERFAPVTWNERTTSYISPEGLKKKAKRKVVTQVRTAKKTS